MKGRFYFLLSVLMLLSINNLIARDMKKTIYFAGGCFWGTEHFFKQIRGVLETEVGYANGLLDKEVGYEDVKTGRTGFAETVKVVYNPEDIGLNMLLDLYYKTIDPTSLNRQGYDVGSQYRTGVYYTDLADSSIIQNSLDKLALNYKEAVVIECLPLKNFYKAEDYHQDYLDKHKNGYCHIPTHLFKYAAEANMKKDKVDTLEYKRLSDSELKQKLSYLEYEVTQNNATERPFANKYWNEFREGIYVDITTGEPLFLSTDKFDSSCGWPSFSQAISSKLLEEKKDNSHNMQRVEVRSKLGDAHLGHVFNDGPKDKGGLRYCINSAALRFIPKEDMEKSGYAKFIPLLNKKK